jgi:hypothetical protein
MWKLGTRPRAVSFLGIHRSDLICSVDQVKLPSCSSSFISHHLRHHLPFFGILQNAHSQNWFPTFFVLPDKFIFYLQRKKLNYLSYMTIANVCISQILRQRQVTEDLENIIMASKLNHHWKYPILLHGFK